MKRQKPKYKQIIEAALSVIAENGYHSSQVAKIAKEAGVADGTIYLYFENKEDILVSVFKEKMGQFTHRIQKQIERQSNASDKLHALIHTHFAQLSENYELAIVAQLELRQSNKDLRLKINQVLKQYFNIIDLIIKEGMADGLFRSDLQLPLVRQMIFGTLDETVTTWLMQERRYNLVKLTDDVHRLIVQGIQD
ncbi:MAG TPA: TetR/AcrR family transcriptional regulator [Bacillota bacterium]|nr:TetR/AcrR family transcriptional regulator [Bacillota bacterium]